MGYSPAAGRENRLAVRYREVALSELATRLHIAMSDAVTTPAERTTCHDRSSQPSDFASAKSGTATASAMRKIWAARTGGCWLIRALPVHAHVAFVGVGGIATPTRLSPSSAVQQTSSMRRRITSPFPAADSSAAVVP